MVGYEGDESSDWLERLWVQWLVGKSMGPAVGIDGYGSRGCF